MLNLTSLGRLIPSEFILFCRSFFSLYDIKGSTFGKDEQEFPDIWEYEPEEPFFE